MRASIVEVDLSEWLYSLGEGIPLDWATDDRGESFKWQEFLGIYQGKEATTIFCRVDDRYFKFVDFVDLTHQEICDRIYNLLEIEEALAPYL